MFEAGLLRHRLRFNQSAQLAQVDFLSHIVEHENPEGTAQRPHPSILPHAGVMLIFPYPLRRVQV